jgi:acyl-CoA synthetase
MLLTLFNKEDYDRYYAGGFWRDDTIYSLVKQHAARAPSCVAVRDNARTCTYAELLGLADAFASDLAERGVVAGQRIAVWLPSRIETVVALVACSRNALICCLSLHRDHTVTQIVDLLKRMRAAAFVGQRGYGADADRYDIFKRLREVDSILHGYHLRGVSSSPRNGIVPERNHENFQRFPAQEQDANRVLYLAFTSGTTGEPKGVMHSNNTLLSNARALSADWDIDGTSVIYSLSPLSHNLGFGAMVMALAVGGQLVVHDVPRGQSLLDRLIETGTTFLVGVPTHAIDLLAELKERQASNAGKLTGFRISGAPIPRDVVRGLLEHGVLPQSGYGMTETCSHQYTRPDDEPRLIIETCGRAAAGYEVRTFSLDDPEKETPATEIGQIGGRGASLMLGYFNDQLATEASFNEAGWFMTGDLGWLDEQGYLRITGRRKDVIIRGGHNIYPARMEALAAKHPAVKRAAAVAIPDERLGEKVCLVVTFRRGHVADAQEILEHLDRSGLSKYDMPEYFASVEEIPLTASGKLRKRDISDWITHGSLKPQRIKLQKKHTE